MNAFNKLFPFFSCVVLIFSCAPSNTPEIQSGIANVTGKFTDSISIEQKGSPIIITLTVMDLILGHDVEYETTLNEDGTFVFEIPVVCASFGRIISEMYNGVVSLTPNEETKLEITTERKINRISGLSWTSKEFENMNIVSQEVLEAYLESQNNVMPFQPDMQPDVYRKYIISKMETELAIVKNSTKLPEELKQILYYNLRLFYLDTNLLNYKGPIKPEKFYYSFLQDFDLNNPQYVYSDYYFSILQSILANKILDIPPIADRDINDWLQEVKMTMVDLIGSDTGLFYDLLAANAYVKQFRNKTSPLSDTQKENIRIYFKNKSFIDILFAENEKIIERVEESSFPEINETSLTSLKINETPTVPKERLMAAIVSGYKGKVILVDMWATWCAPCLEAMKRSKHLKNEMKDKNIVFVYITSSSPHDEWKKKIYEIGGEHYYLNGDEGEYIANNLGFNAIPTYLLYDKNGTLKRKCTGYPGTKELRQWIEELLP